jgi:hypothetical protein
MLLKYELTQIYFAITGAKASIVILRITVSCLLLSIALWAARALGDRSSFIIVIKDYHKKVAFLTHLTICALIVKYRKDVLIYRKEEDQMAVFTVNY